MTWKNNNSFLPFLILTPTYTVTNASVLRDAPEHVQGFLFFQLPLDNSIRTADFPSYWYESKIVSVTHKLPFPMHGTDALTTSTLQVTFNLEMHRKLSFIPVALLSAPNQGQYVTLQKKLSEISCLNNITNLVKSRKQVHIEYLCSRGSWMSSVS